MFWLCNVTNIRIDIIKGQESYANNIKCKVKKNTSEIVKSLKLSGKHCLQNAIL